MIEMRRYMLRNVFISFHDMLLMFFTIESIKRGKETNSKNDSKTKNIKNFVLTKKSFDFNISFFKGKISQENAKKSLNVICSLREEKR